MLARVMFIVFERLEDFSDLNSDDSDAMNLAKGEFLSCTGMFGIGIPALAIAEARASVSTGACSFELVISFTKPQSRAS